jgi:hypothetical protein
VLVASAVLFVVGVVAALTKGEPHVGPAACARRVASSLEYPVLGEPSVERTGDMWVATVASTRVVLKVEGAGHRVTGVQAYAGAGADLLERPQRLAALATSC